MLMTLTDRDLQKRVFDIVYNMEGYYFGFELPNDVIDFCEFVSEKLSTKKAYRKMDAWTALYYFTRSKELSERQIDVYMIETIQDAINKGEI